MRLRAPLPEKIPIKPREQTSRNPSFADYLIPTALDMPTVVIAGFIEVPEPGAPYGAKGIGEPPTISSTIRCLWGWLLRHRRNNHPQGLSGRVAYETLVSFSR